MNRPEELRAELARRMGALTQDWPLDETVMAWASQALTDGSLVVIHRTAKELELVIHQRGNLEDFL